jgi:mRNA-degrading endonuclease RelE of RelBE toxin-antitoxin system
MVFKSVTADRFDKKFSKLTSKNSPFKQQLINKMKGVRRNSDIGEPKSDNLKGLRSLRVSKHYVIIYLIFKDLVVFIHIDHHDQAYNAEVINQLIRRLSVDAKVRVMLEKAGVTPLDFAKFIRYIGNN